MPRGPRLRIALAVSADGEYSRRVLRGVIGYADREANWLFNISSLAPADLRALGAWRPDGVIAHLTDRRQGTLLERLGRPLVNVAFALGGQEPPRVGNDDRAIGALAAEHFLTRRFRRFAFVGWPGLEFSELRQAGFRRALAVAGFDCACYQAAGAVQPRAARGARRDHERLCAWIAALPAATAIMACNDRRAWDALQACRETGRRVPADLALLGVDNDEAWCLLANPPLSSVEVNAEEIGRRAAQLLAQLLDGGRLRSRAVSIPPLGVRARSSSDMLAVDDPLVAQALTMISEQAAEPIQVVDVLERCAVSRRRLERAFLRSFGATPAAAIRSARLQRAKELLAASDLAMPSIAQRSGFSCAKQLSVVFRRETGQTPTAYRAQFRRRR